MQERELIGADTLAAIANMIDTSQITAAISAVLGQSHATFGSSINIVGSLPAIPMPQLFDAGPALASIANMIDTSTAAITAVLGQSHATFGSSINIAGSLSAIPMPQLFDAGPALASLTNMIDTSPITAALAMPVELFQASLASTLNISDLLQPDYVDETQPLDDLVERLVHRPPIDVGEQRETADDGPAADDHVARNVILLLVVLLATSTAFAAGSVEELVAFAQHLLESAEFAGTAVFAAYSAAAAVLPDDNVLGWLIALDWLFSWLRGAEGTES